MTFSAFLPSITEVKVGTKYVLNGLNNENYKLFNDAYEDSVTNSACINDISNLIKGDGIINAIAGGKNPSIYLSDDDFGLICLDYKKQGQTAIQVIWYDGKPVKIFHIPMEQTALNVDNENKIDGYWYCYDWKKTWKYIPKFYPKFSKENPENKTQMSIIKRPSNDSFFAKPDWYPALRWAQDEGIMAQHSYKDISTGFSGQKVINWVGGRGLTDDQKDAVALKISDKFSGIDGKRNIVSINNSVENSIVIDNIDPPNVNATYVNYTEEAERKILIAHSYPAILLAGSKTGFSSNADEISVATKSVFRRVINPTRKTLLAGLQDIFDVIGNVVLAIQDFETEEMDNNSNGQPVERLIDKTAEQQNAEAQAQLRGSVGGVQALLEIQASYVAKTTSYESAIAMINLIYGFTEEESRKLLGNPQNAPIPTQFEQERKYMEAHDYKNVDDAVKNNVEIIVKDGKISKINKNLNY